LNKNNARYIIFNIIYRFLDTKKSLKIILDNSIKKIYSNQKDVSFITNAVKGILRDKKILDENIYLYSKSKNIDKKTLALLYLGTYQLLYCNSVPDYASINTTVDISKSVQKKSTSFINAILRKISKNSYKKTTKIRSKYPQIYYSYPKWILEKLYATYNDRLYSICDANSSKAPIWLRINILKTDFNEISNLLSENRIDFHKDSFLSNYIKINKFDQKKVILKLINDGRLYVQNPSSGFVVKLLNPSKNDYVLDACSAPGGKSSFIAELLNENIKLDCMDIEKKRLERMRKNFNRLGIKNIKFICNDAALIKTDKKYNKILLDLPCTSSGTIRKNPDIKWKLSKKNITQLKETQYRILENMKNNLTDQGEIIYSTCSIFDEENHENIIKFLKHNPAFHISKINKDIPDMLKNNLGGITILPDINDYEGMFAIKIKKNA